MQRFEVQACPLASDGSGSESGLKFARSNAKIKTSNQLNWAVSRTEG